MRPVRRRIAIGLLGCVLALAVSPHAVAQDERPRAVDARVVGQVVDGAGGPLGGVPVIVRATDTGSGFGDLLLFGAFVTFTAGLGLLTCMDDGCPFASGQGVVARTSTGGDGSYSATLPESYVAGEETDTDWIVGAEVGPRPGERVGPSSSFEFEVNIQTQQAPSLPLWTTTPQVSVDGWAVAVDASGAPTDVERVGSELVTDYGRLSGSATGVLDARLLEVPAGARAGMAAGGTGSRDVRVPHANGRTIYHQRLRSGFVPVDLAPVPPSRKAACSGRRRDGAAATVTGPAGCRLTDGDLETALVPPPPDDGDPFDDRSSTDDPVRYDPSTTTTLDPTIVTEITVELARPTPLGLVVVRGATGGAPVVEASEDGTSWDRLRTGSVGGLDRGSATTAQPSRNLTARYLRLTSSDVEHVTEISAWERTPGEDLDPPPSTDPVVGSSDRDVAAPTAGDRPRDEDGGGPDLLVLLVLLALAVLLGRWALARYRAAAALPPPPPPAITDAARPIPPPPPPLPGPPSVPKPWTEPPAPTPANKAAPAKKPAPAKKAAPAKTSASAKKAAPARKAASAKQAAPAKNAAPAKTAGSAKRQAAPAKQAVAKRQAASTQEAAPEQQAAPAKAAGTRKRATEPQAAAPRQRPGPS